MAVPQYRDEVLVTLTSLDAPPSFSFPDRRFFLTREKPVMDIGRTSKRNTSFEAAKNNAWFDSPVMSRDHAHLKLDAEKQKVYIKDIGSLHGTFKNEQRLAQNVPSSVGTGDVIRFGISIDRGSDRYPPCTMEARFKFGTASPEDRPKVFRVPDDSDVEDSSSDDDQSVRISSDILRSSNIRPAAYPSSSPSPPVEVICIDQYPLSNVRGDDDYNTNALPPVASSANPVQEVTYVDLSSPSPEQVPEYNGFSPISPEAGWMVGAEMEECDINLSESTDMDTDSSQGADSPSQSPSPSPSLHPSSIPNDYDNQDALDIEEHDFEEHDEFEDREYGSEQRDEPVSPEIDDVADQFTAPDSHGNIEDLVTGITFNVHEEIESTAAEASTSDNAGQDIHHNECNPLGGVGYMLNTQLPPIEQPKVVFPPWAQPFYSQPLRLPSISEAMPAYTTNQAAGTKTGAELLGAKTGKYEFFAARAENKMHALPCGMATSSSSIPAIHSESSEHTATANVMPQHSPAADSSTPQQSTPSPAEPLQPQTDPSGRLAPSEWTASGVQFLNSPLEETQETREPLHEEPPVLDDTSAYQFELSKKAATGPTTESHMVDTQTQTRSAKRTHMEISDILEASNEIRDQQTPSDRPSKRKAEEISELLSEDRAIEDAPRATQKRIRSLSAQRRFRTFLRRTHQAPVANMTAPTAVEPPIQPPAKRLRRVAEVVGIAALGGVAVMSALIVTAPTF
ncbi:hypothetical protein G7Z17_g12969 [Cylindrodendrum hubeiense]|uniref:FHA domain-containing protein n=1 Tax=Cylindrodendrum hubeiense TaxID=595255 RepID=A0A9P5GXA7_9HYPO|nr:hypothetical protein G7Z17_g12969 [Cylindrodendrum hubeiense]